jgi:hypothetical protein
MLPPLSLSPDGLPPLRPDTLRAMEALRRMDPSRRMDGARPSGPPDWRRNSFSMKDWRGCWDSGMEARTWCCREQVMQEASR